VKYVFDNSASEKKYIFGALRALAGSYQHEFSIDGFDFYYLTPTGGRPDEDIVYESICTMSCEGAGRRLE
jgi:hypothetical protein